MNWVCLRSRLLPALILCFPHAAEQWYVIIQILHLTTVHWETVSLFPDLSHCNFKYFEHLFSDVCTNPNFHFPAVNAGIVFTAKHSDCIFNLERIWNVSGLIVPFHILV